MYDFDAGDLSLDYANTQNWHASHKPIEYLESYSDLVEWGLKAGLIAAEKAEGLKRFAADQPQEAERMYDRAIQVREAIYRIFSHHYTGQPISEADLSIFTDEVCQAMSHLHLETKGNDFHWQLPSNLLDVNLILWPVVRAAADLLTSEKAAHVRQCEDDRGCGYLFIDQTKNHSRRWCSMESCGNRAKARRHYSRKQAN